MADALETVPPTPVVTTDQLALIKKTLAKDATDDELQLFFYDCQRRGVHPLDGLIHFTKRSGRYRPVTSIDFMRLRAAATHECLGIDDAVFHGPPKTVEFSATVTVYRHVQGQRCAFTATARWAEYVPDQAFMWQKMPHTMLGKCAEALALRKGFPQELSGLYESAELDQASTPTDAIERPPKLITQADRKKLFAIATKAGWQTDQIRAAMLEHFQMDGTGAITTATYDDIVTFFSDPPPSAPTDTPF